VQTIHRINESELVRILKRGESKVKHYVSMSGLHASIPDHCEVFDKRKDAIADLVDMFRLGRTRATRLSKNGYVELKRTAIEMAQDWEEFGAEYCEVVECSCSNPMEHSDARIGQLDGGAR
jgi:hypothetical protein